MVERLRCTVIILVILGIGFLISSILLFVYGGSLTDSSVKKGCELREGTPAYEIWRHPPVPLRLSFYVYDLNDTEFLSDPNKRPFVHIRGPFVYTERRTKDDVQIYENGTISYHELRNYTFERFHSCETCDESTVVTTMNIVYMALVNYLQTEHVSPVFRHIVGEFLSFNEQPVMQRTVKEFLWGYEDPLLELLQGIFPDLIANDLVSVFNASVSGAGLDTYLIDSGIDVYKNDSNHIKNVGNIKRFNYQTRVPNWLTDYANMVNGTDSTIWHPAADEDDHVNIYSSDLCRSFRLPYSNTHSNNYGIKLRRYELPPDVYANSSENQGFCVNTTGPNHTHTIECLPDGLMSLKPCIKLSGSAISLPLPIIVSSPHFLDAAQKVKDAVGGLNPDPEIHRSFMDVEPITGNVMNGSRRMQINLNVVRDESIEIISQLTSFVYPMIWLDEHAEIDDIRAKQFHSEVVVPMTTLEAMKYVLLSLGCVLFIVVVILLIRNHHRANSEGPAFPDLNPDDTSPLLP